MNIVLEIILWLLFGVIVLTIGSTLMVLWMKYIMMPIFEYLKILE
jgi:hypothetical protein